MPEQILCHNRLTVIGSRSAITRFADDLAWKKQVGARHWQWLEHDPGRYVGQFMTNAIPIPAFVVLSKTWPTLTFLLDYEDEEERIKGLAKVKKGELEHCQIRY